MTDHYYYLAGPMTGYPKFNFPAFDAAAADLRAYGYTIMTPSEFDDPRVREVKLASIDGTEEPEAEYLSYLRRDAQIVMDPRCKGVICLPGWQASRGAQMETFLCETFGKPLYEYLGGGAVDPIDRTTEMNADALHQ